MDDTSVISVLRTVLELGWPGVVMVAITIVWREHKRRTDELIANLREEMESCRRQSEMLLGLVLDRAKVQQVYDPERKRFPPQAEMVDED